MACKSSHEQDRSIPVPYTSRLLEIIQPGQSLVIHGEVIDGAESFAVNLLTDCLEISPNVGGVPLHINPRFDEKKLVLNSFLNAEWGKEERHSIPFKAGTPFDLRIRVHEDKFEIWANQKHVADFKHRVPITSVTHLQVKGDITLSGVHWGGRYFKTPFTTPFHDTSLRTGQRVYVYGIPKSNFSVNFVGDNEDSLFHFNPRFNEKQVVRGAQCNGIWGEEEREGSFPFKKDIAFDLVIYNEPYSIQVFVNGKRFVTFAHRVADPNRHYRMLKIEGDVEVTGVEVSH